MEGSSRVESQAEGVVTLEGLDKRVTEMWHMLQTISQAVTGSQSARAVSGGVSQGSDSAPPPQAEAAATEAGESAGSAGRTRGGKSDQAKLPKPLNPESYDGSPAKLRDFFLDVELWQAGYSEAPMADKVLALGQFLKGPAKECYRDLMLQVRAEGRQVADVTVSDVLAALQKRFGSVTEEDDAWQELIRAKQGSDTAAAFAARLRRIFAKPGMAQIANEEVRVRAYRQGLNLELQELLLLQQFSTLDAIAQAACMAEKLRAALSQANRWKQRPARFHSMQHSGDADESQDDWEGERQPEEEQAADGDSAGLAVMRNAAQGRGAGRGRPPYRGQPAGGAFPGRGRGRSQPAPQSAEPDDEACVAGADGRVVKRIRCHTCGRKGHFRDQCPSGQKQQEN